MEKENKLTVEQELKNVELTDNELNNIVGGTGAQEDVLTKNNILIQTATAMLELAGQQNQDTLTFLQ
ncbi:MAG: bacteriocin [Alphaproteobacteria bacterium]|nr:bacteriocin [Alphaproteobacteria bacterium]